MLRRTRRDTTYDLEGGVQAEGNRTSVTDEELKKLPDDDSSSQTHAKGWKDARTHFKKLDDAVMRDYDDEVNTVLIFAGLFSAVLTSFIVQVYQGLDDDNAATSAMILRRISMQLEGSSASLKLVALPPAHTDVSATIIAVNILWFSSLILSLFAALFGILVKQWLHVYSQWSERAQPKNTLILRDFYQEAFLRWKVPQIIGALPVLLQAALLLFVLGLVAYLWTVNYAVAGVLTALVSGFVILAIFTIVLPAFFNDCPYKSPLGLLITVLRGHPSHRNLSRWQDGDLREASSLLPNSDKKPLDRVFAESCMVLDIHPRVELEEVLGKDTFHGTLIESRVNELDPDILHLLLGLLVGLARRRDLAKSKSSMRGLRLLSHVFQAAAGEDRSEALMKLADVFQRPFHKLKNMGTPTLTHISGILHRQISAHPRDLTARQLMGMAIYFGKSGQVIESPSRSTINACLEVMNIAAGALSRDADLQAHLKHQPLLDVYNNLVDRFETLIHAASLDYTIPTAVIKTSEVRFCEIFALHRQDSVFPMETLQAHENCVLSVSFSADGKRIVSGSMDNTVRVWDVITGTVLATLHGHKNLVRSVAFSPDRKRIISGSLDRTVRVWNADTGAVLATLRGHGGDVASVTCSSDGRYIASGSHDMTVRIWDANTGEVLKILHGSTDLLWSVSFSKDGRRIASGSLDCAVCVWDVNSGEMLWTRKEHRGDVRSVAFSPDGKTIASGAHDDEVFFWDADTGEVLTKLQGHESWVVYVAFSPDGKHVASASLDKTVRVWDVNTSTVLHILKCHKEGVHSVAFSPDGTRIASGSFDMTMKVWDAKTGVERDARQGHGGQVNSVMFSPCGTRMASGSDDMTVRVWDAKTGGQLATLQGHEGRVLFVAFSPDEQCIASCSDDRTVRLWNASTGAVLATLQGHENRVNSAVFSPDGTRIASCSEDMTVRMWDVNTGAAIATRRVDEHAVISVEFSPDGTHIISCDHNELNHAWDVHEYLSTPTESSLCATSSNATFPLFSFHSGWLLAQAAADTIPRRLHLVPKDIEPAKIGAMSWHGCMVALGSKSGAVTVLDCSTAFWAMDAARNNHL